VRKELCADSLEVQLPHGGVSAGENRPNGGPARRTEGVEDKGMLLAHIGGHGRLQPFGGPAMGTAAFVPDAPFILAPQFNDFSGMSGGDCL
jgi:hypothetical protein